MWNRSCPWLLLAIGLALATPPASAQTTSGSISGTVTDAQGAPVPGAAVTITNNQRGDSLTAVTSAAGTFTFPQVQPSDYTLKVTLEGFRTAERTNVVLNANDRLNAGIIVLEVGQLTETV